MYVTPAELRDLAAELNALLARYHDRLVDASLRPPGARSVEFVAAAFPAQFGRVAGDSASKN